MTAPETSDKKEGARFNSKQDGDEKDQGKENEDENKVDQFCFGCKSSLAKSPELINITGQARHRWHPECFKCMICHEPMDKRQSCHVYKDQIFCRTDYLRLKRDHSIKCKRCQWPIGASDWVRRAADYVYHLACFNCDICFRQLNTGEQFVINLQKDSCNSGTNEEAKRGREQQHQQPNVRLMCKLHFTVDGSRRNNTVRQDEEIVPTEIGARSPDLIISKTIGKLDSSIKVHNKQRRHHQTPLKPGQFHLLAPPTATSATCSSSSIISSTDFQVPSLAINQSQQLQQTPTPHPTATPTLASRQHLINKDYPLMASPTASNLMLDDSSFMSMANHRIPSSSSTTSTSSSTSSSSSSSSSTATTTTTTNNNNNNNMTSGPMTPGGSGGGGGGSASGMQSKSKRVRTTFTEDQLSILQTHFQIDSNPDGQDLERIATITGLSKRVTQVWFQNSRARQKKYMIKRKPGGSHGSGGAGLVALGHSHGHGGQRQNSIHQSLALIGQSLSSPGGASGSPNLDLSDDLQNSAARDPLRFQTFDSLIHQHQFRDASSSFVLAGRSAMSSGSAPNEKGHNGDSNLQNNNRDELHIFEEESRPDENENDDDDEMSESIIDDDDDDQDELGGSRMVSPDTIPDGQAINTPERTNPA